MAPWKRAAPVMTEYGWRKPTPSEMYRINGQAVPALKFRREPVYVSDRDAIARQEAMLSDPAHLAWLASPPDTDADAGTAPPAPEPVPVAVRVAPEGFGAANGQGEAGERDDDLCPACGGENDTARDATCTGCQSQAMLRSARRPVDPASELARARAALVRLGVLVADSWEVAA